ncbi:uncharacterized protein BXZ73DRAFT_79728 [Epithele typhae]|uniref:uncharacterized protein n=1 Tax=Epithele typhae TaxID=378194 RepID=UPI0020074E3C|nr:uncharacterized protein BXZ73DRAFT_79728 [Epithele typhae]KAH9922332.1 hypothetical protein BXZ73DRAFT_79728 [Epithele typhae]
MGVAGLWDLIQNQVLRPAGKPRSLTHLAVKDGFEANPDGKRGFRVGIDASIWFYHATYGREGENPELRTLFFRCTRLMSMPFLPLFVFDGPKRPEVKRGKRISGKNHWMVQGMQEIIAAFGFEWRMAPGEAEAELAYLNRIGVIDGILSDDVDTFLFGAQLVVRNPSTTLTGNKSHSLKNADGREDGNHVMTYHAADLLAHRDIGLTQGGLVLFGVLRGGDYSPGLHGCGVATAHGLARAGFGDRLLDAARTLPRDELADFLVGWRAGVRAELRANASGCLPRKSPALAKALGEDFPDVDVLLSYARPATSEEKGAGHRNANVDWDREPDLGRIAGLCEMYFEWGLREVIVKRFRTVLWPSAVLRILRRAAILRDRGEQRKRAAAVPATPRKDGKERRAPPGTPSSMIAKHFSTMALDSPQRSGDSEDEDEDEERLIVRIHSSRQHASTDDVLEYRLEVAPAQLVRLCEAGIRGLRTALPPDLSDDEDDDDEGGGKKGKRTKKPPPDPDSHVRIWLPACMVDIVEPQLVEEFQGVRQKKADKKAGKGKAKEATKEKGASKAALRKLPSVMALAEEEEESESDAGPSPSKARPSSVTVHAEIDSPSKAAPKRRPTKEATAAKENTRKVAGKEDSSKISQFYAAKKVTTTSDSAKVATSTASRVADLFKDFELPSSQRLPAEPADMEGPRKPKPKARAAAKPPVSSTAPSSGSGSAMSGSNLLSYLDNLPSASSSQGSSSSSRVPLSSKSTEHSYRPFPMDFEQYKLGEDLDIDDSEDEDENPFTTNATSNRGPTASSSSSSPRTRTRTSLTASDDSDAARQALQKSPRRSEKHKSRAKVADALRCEEEEESSESDRAPSPSPMKPRQPSRMFRGARVSRGKRNKRFPGLPPAPSRRSPPVPGRLVYHLDIKRLRGRRPVTPQRRPTKSAPLLGAKAKFKPTQTTSTSLPQPAAMEAVRRPPRQVYEPEDVIDLT